MLQEVHQSCSSCFLRTNDNEVGKVLTFPLSALWEDLQVSFVIARIRPSRCLCFFRIVLEVFVRKLLGRQLNESQIRHFEEELEGLSKSIQGQPIASVVLHVRHEDVHFIQQKLRKQFTSVDRCLKSVWAIRELFVVLSMCIEAASLARKNLKAYFEIRAYSLSLQWGVD